MTKAASGPMPEGGLPYRRAAAAGLPYRRAAAAREGARGAGPAVSGVRKRRTLTVGELPHESGTERLQVARFAAGDERRGRRVADLDLLVDPGPSRVADVGRQAR